MSYRWRVGFYTALSLIGYALPWIVGKGSALNMGAYDLAEWASLHPLNRDAAFPFITSALLRIALALLALFLATQTFHFRRLSFAWWIVIVSLVVFVLALLPPLEWITESPRDLNYLQQMAIAAGLACAYLLLLSNLISRRLKNRIAIIILSIAIVCGWTGLYQAIGLFNQLELKAIMGPGLILFSIAVAMALIDTSINAKRVNYISLPSRI